MQEVELNIRIYLIMALGTRTYLHEYIDEVYKKNSLEYYELYKSLNLDNDVSFTFQTTEKAEHMKKVAGILEWCYKYNEFTPLHKLIQKGYKVCWNYIKTRDTVNLEHFVNYYVRKYGGYDNVSEIEMFYHEIVIMYLCYKKNIPLDVNNARGAHFMGALELYRDNYFRKEMQFSEKYIESLRSRIDELYDEYVYSSTSKEYKLDSILENLITREMIKIDPRCESPLSMQEEEYMKARDKAFSSGVAKYIGSFSGWLNVLGIDFLDMSGETVFTNDDLDLIFAQYINAVDYNNLSAEDRDQFIISLMVTKAVVYEYKKTKESYLSKVKDDFYNEMELAKKSIKEKEASLKKKEEEMNTKLSLAHSENEELKKELAKLRSENKKLSKRLEESENFSKEVFALREFIYSIEDSSTDEVVENDEMERMVESLQEGKYTVIGGNVRWQNKLKDLLPNFNIVSAESKSIDLSFLDNVDALFINTATNSHGLYEKIMARMSKNDTKLFYLNANRNMELTIEEIYRCLNM